jgi:hypothetical protein
MLITGVSPRVAARAQTAERSDTAETACIAADFSIWVDDVVVINPDPNGLMLPERNKQGGGIIAP